MLVDVHSHYLQPEHLSDDFKHQAVRVSRGAKINLSVKWDSTTPPHPNAESQLSLAERQGFRECGSRTMRSLLM
jgi:hypothetical protein